MNYIYDILVNFNDELYNFYDWNLNDEIINIRKTPVFRVDSNTLHDIKKCEVEFEEEFLKKIYNKAEVFSSKKLKAIPYSCLFCDRMEVIAVNITDTNLEKSSLLLDEEEEVIDFSNRLEETKLRYRIVCENKTENYKTRMEIEKEKLVKREIKNLKNEKNINKIKYLYYECFNEKEKTKEKMIDKFELEIKNNPDELVQKMYNFFKLLQFNK